MYICCPCLICTPVSNEANTFFPARIGRCLRELCKTVKGPGRLTG